MIRAGAGSRCRQTIHRAPILNRPPSDGHIRYSRSGQGRWRDFMVVEKAALAPGTDGKPVKPVPAGAPLQRSRRVAWNGPGVLQFTGRLLWLVLAFTSYYERDGGGGRGPGTTACPAPTPRG